MEKGREDGKEETKWEKGGEERMRKRRRE